MPAKHFIPNLLFRQTTVRGTLFSLTRHIFKPRSSFYVHTHRDFCELFWVESGRGMHLINGQSVPLPRGSLVMVRQKDIHGFRNRDEETLTMVNLSFPVRTVSLWRERYGYSNRFFWSRSALPCSWDLDAAQMRRLHTWSVALSHSENQLVHLDRFFIDLIEMLGPEETSGASRGTLPPRVEQALVLIRQPEYCAEGVHRLASLAGCSLQHLNRLLNRYLGQTAGAVVTQERLRHAARQLQLSEESIIDISMDCGFNNLGHFYLQFKKHYGLTPRQYRLRHQLVMGR